jgi:predicted alpha/beta-hydrolase family hydrolase
VVLAACAGGGADAPEGSRAIRVRGPDGTELSARVAGEGPVTLVLAHGAGTDMSSWFAAMDRFARAGYRVVAGSIHGSDLLSRRTPERTPGAAPVRT